MIKLHPTHTIVDSSKLDTGQNCWRQFFFQYILGWRPDKPEHDLYFGECWHMAREYQLINGYEDVKGAYLTFINHYRKKFPDGTDNIFRPKDPFAVAMALNKFATEKNTDLRDNKLLFSEVSGTVPIDERRVLHYRLDSVFEKLENGKIFSWDHKTTTEKSINYKWWADSFYLGLQNGTYTHCLYCMYPIEQVIGIEFCGTAFGFLSRNQEYRITLKRVPAWKDPNQMNVWLWTVNDLYDRYEMELDRLSHCKESDAILMAFPLQSGSCSKYRGCVFHDYCMSWPNPLRQCQEPPLGFKEDFWNPAEMETTNKMDLEWK